MAGVTLTDEELIGLVARHESWALAELYDRYARFVFSLALKVLDDRAGAEEMVAQVFSNVWRAAPDDAADRGQFSSWLIRITHHQCIDHLHRSPLCPVAKATEDGPLLELASDDDPPDGAAYSFERMRRALAQIPAEQRRVIELAFFHGLTHREIANIRSEPLSAVENQVRLGMHKLRDLLRE